MLLRIPSTTALILYPKRPQDARTKNFKLSLIRFPVQQEGVQPKATQGPRNLRATPHYTSPYYTLPDTIRLTMRYYSILYILYYSVTILKLHRMYPRKRTFGERAGTQLGVRRGGLGLKA